ncbi:unnamed protein product, partial [marine sediment metagenome]
MILVIVILIVLILIVGICCFSIKNDIYRGGKAADVESLYQIFFATLPKIKKDGNIYNELLKSQYRGYTFKNYFTDLTTAIAGDEPDIPLSAASIEQWNEAANRSYILNRFNYRHIAELNEWLSLPTCYITYFKEVFNRSIDDIKKYSKSSSKDDYEAWKIEKKNDIPETIRTVMELYYNMDKS